MMPTSVLSILLMLVLAAALMLGIAGLQKRLSLNPEWSRKLLHTGGGLMALGLPWLFQSAWPVMILSAMSLLGLLAVKRHSGVAAPGRRRRRPCRPKITWRPLFRVGDRPAVPDRGRRSASFQCTDADPDLCRFGRRPGGAALRPASVPGLRRDKDRGRFDGIFLHGFFQRSGRTAGFCGQRPHRDPADSALDCPALEPGRSRRRQGNRQFFHPHHGLPAS